MRFICKVLSIILFFSGTYVAIFGVSVNKWSVASGTISKSQIYESTHIKNGVKRTRYGVSVNYYYFVNGNRHHGDRIRIVDEATSNDSAQKKLIKYKKDTVVDVFYNPGNPSESFLEKDFSEACFVFFFLSFIFYKVSKKDD